MPNSREVEPAPAASFSRAYKLPSGTYRRVAWKDGLLYFSPERREIEVRQFVGWRKKKQRVVARFRAEQEAAVDVDGASLKVGELSITLESPTVASEIAEVLNLPKKQREEQKRLLSEAEAMVTGFLLVRDHAVRALAKVKDNPRDGLIALMSEVNFDAKEEPLQEVYSTYSARLKESLEGVESYLKGARGQLGPRVIERLCALAFTIGLVQDAALRPDSEVSDWLSALQELGVKANSEELASEGATQELIAKAHPALEGLLTLASL